MKRQAKEGYSLIPEGEHVLKIKDVDEKDYDKFQKIAVIFEDASGTTMRENFSFVKDDGTPNEVADAVFTRLARAALNDQTLDEIDSSELPGCYVRVEIEHNEGAKGGTFANIKKYVGYASKFDKAAKTTAPTSSKPSGAPAKKTAAEILAEAKARAAAKK